MLYIFIALTFIYFYMVRDRLLDICRELGVSASQFSLSIGKSRPYLANLNKDITTEVLLNIHTAYPTVNIMRIITGMGDILLKNQSDYDNNLNSYLISRIKSLEEENKELNKEVGRFEILLSESKKNVQGEENVVCAIAK